MAEPKGPAYFYSEGSLKPQDEDAVSICSIDEREILHEQHDELVQTLPANDIAPKLYSDFLLTDTEYESVRAAGTTTVKNQIILDSLVRKPRGFIGRLCKLLELIPSTEHICNALSTAKRTKQVTGTSLPRKATLQRKGQHSGSRETFIALTTQIDQLKADNQELQKSNQWYQNRCQQFEDRYIRERQNALTETQQYKLQMKELLANVDKYKSKYKSLKANTENKIIEARKQAEETGRAYFMDCVKLRGALLKQSNALQYTANEFPQYERPEAFSLLSTEDSRVGLNMAPYLYRQQVSTDTSSLFSSDEEDPDRSDMSSCENLHPHLYRKPEPRSPTPQHHDQMKRHDSTQSLQVSSAYSPETTLPHHLRHSTENISVNHQQHHSVKHEPTRNLTTPTRNKGISLYTTTGSSTPATVAMRDRASSSREKKPGFWDTLFGSRSKQPKERRARPPQRNKERDPISQQPLPYYRHADPGHTASRTDESEYESAHSDLEEGTEINRRRQKTSTSTRGKPVSDHIITPPQPNVSTKRHTFKPLFVRPNSNEWQPQPLTPDKQTKHQGSNWSLRKLFMGGSKTDLHKPEIV